MSDPLLRELITDDFVAALATALVQAGWAPMDRVDLLRKNAHPTIREALEVACEALEGPPNGEKSGV